MNGKRPLCSGNRKGLGRVHYLLRYALNEAGSISDNALVLKNLIWWTE